MVVPGQVMRRGLPLAFAAVCTLAFGPALADAPPAQLTEARGLGAVGRIEFGKTAFCTGALITKDLVLTAAHCLFDADGRAYLPEDIRFLAGARQGRALASRSVSAVYLHPSYVDGAALDQPTALASVYDLAVIQLKAPIEDARILPFALGEVPKLGEKVQVVSYAFDRPDFPALENDCIMLEQEAGLLVLTCDVDFGASGAPVLMRKDGENQLVSLIAAKAEAAGRKVSLGLRLDLQLAALLALLPPETRPVEPLGDLPVQRPAR